MGFERGGMQERHKFKWCQDETGDNEGAVWGANVEHMIVIQCLCTPNIHNLSLFCGQVSVVGRPRVTECGSVFNRCARGTGDIPTPLIWLLIVIDVLVLFSDSAISIG